MTAPTGALGPARHPERDAVAPWMVVLAAVAAAVAMGAGGLLVAQGRLTPLVGAALAGTAGALAVAGLPSLSLRTSARLAAATSGAAMVGLGRLSGPALSDVLAAAAWVVAVVAILVVTHAVGPARPARAPRGVDGATPVAVAGRIAAISGVLLVALALVAPTAATHLGQSSSGGDTPSRGGEDDPRPLQTSEVLDTTRRPRLSDRVVMRVQTAHATFWRQDTFDVWDGRSWTRSDPVVRRAGADGRIVAPAHDLGADGTDRIRQRITLEVPAALVLPMAPTATQVEVAADIYQRDDGSVLVDPVLGEGATYTVESRRVPTSAAALRRADGPVPAEVQARFAEDPATTDRVRAAAAAATAGITSTFDRVQALEAWMAARTEYSLDAPLAREGVDVVDDFLFESRQGWCEQIASSLVVLARSVGIPARLAVGYVPGDRDPLTGEVVVREREAHAWAEVWFPEVGWVGFDPTAEVPLAGEDDVDTWADLLRRWGPIVVVGIVAALGVAVLGRTLLRRHHARPSRAPVALLERDLEALGARVGRARGPGETATTYAGAVADRLDAPDVAGVGAVIDASLYAARPPPDDAVVRARQVLSTVGEPPG